MSVSEDTMNVLENYERRCGLEPLTSEQILEQVEAAEDYLQSGNHDAAERQRAMVWLHGRLQAVYDAIDNPAAPVEGRCAWCLRAAGGSDEAWRALPKMNMEDSAAHSQVCEHNPLVHKIRTLEALLEEYGFVRGEGSS